MISFTGRLGFKQCIKDEPTKWDIKVFALSDAKMVMCTDYKYILEKNLNPAVLMLVCLPEYALN